MARLRIGTRGSLLARAQAAHVAGLLTRRLPGTGVEIVVVRVSGDEAGGAPDAPAAPGAADAVAADKSRWVDRIEDALREGRIDLAVHSAKDVPGELGEGLVLLGSPPREDARDALCGAASLDALPPGARVGTMSVRRAAQLLALREDIEIVAVRGNVDTRLRRLGEGACDALVLAYAGLRRLGREHEAGAALGLHDFVPAPGQGILAIEAREGDGAAAGAAAAIADLAATAQLAAERALVYALGATCHTPVGAHASGAGVGATAGAGAKAGAGGGAKAGAGGGAKAGAGGGAKAGELTLSAFVGLPDGSAWVRDRLSGDAAAPADLGRLVARRLLAAGAGEILDGAREPAVAGA